MGELDLQAALAGPRAPPEDLQDEPGPIHHLGVPGLLEIALLDRRHGVVDDDQSAVLRLDEPLYLVDLAGAEQGARPWRRDRHDDALGNIEIDRLGEAGRLGEPIVGAVLGLDVARITIAGPTDAGKHRDEHQRAHHGRLPFDHFSPRASRSLVVGEIVYGSGL